MIVCRRPCTIYDVDVVGFAVLVAIGLVAYFGIVIPAGAHASEYRALAGKIAVANAKTEQTSERVHKVNAEIGVLRSGIAERACAAPKPGAQAGFVQRIASLARECDLQIAQVLPQPVQRADGYRIGDVRFSGQGSALDFMRLLNRLTAENPYFALQDFSIRRPPDTDDPRCALSWTLRLYMLEDESFTPAGDQR